MKLEDTGRESVSSEPGDVKKRVSAKRRGHVKDGESRHGMCY